MKAETRSSLEEAAAAAGSAPATLVSRVPDFETLFGAYRVRPRRKSESLMDARWQRVLDVEKDKSGGNARDAAVAPNAVNFGGEFIHSSGDGTDDMQQRLHRLTTGEAVDVGENNVLVIEDLEGDILAFCGEVDTPTATTSALSTYISVRDGCELDAPTNSLLVRALHGWLGGPAVAAAATQLNLLGTPAGAQEAGRQEEVEMVDWVDTMGRVICALPRPVVHANNVLHRGAGVMIRNDKGEVYCHRRASTKRVFPSMYDMFIGGVSGTMESALTTALRELGEELGLGPYGGGGSVTMMSQADLMIYRGECLVQTGYNRCLVSVFDYRVAPGETFTWQEDEVEWGSYVSWDEVVSRVSEGSWKFVPDGLQVWQHYLRWEAAATAWQGIG